MIAQTWWDEPWCLNGWVSGADHPHYCGREYGHTSRCVCETEGCRSWAKETPPRATVQVACPRCSVGVMDTTNPHAAGACQCRCHALSGGGA